MQPVSARPAASLLAMCMHMRMQFRMHIDIICIVYLYMNMSTPMFMCGIVWVDLVVHAKYEYHIN